MQMSPPPPAGVGKMKEYKFTYNAGSGIISDASNPTLYFIANNKDGTIKRFTVAPGSKVISYYLSNYYSVLTCFAGETADEPILFTWNDNGAFINEELARGYYSGVGENGGFVVFNMTTKGTSFSFYLPQS